MISATKCVVNNVIKMLLELRLLLSTARKDVVYLVGYFIPYRSILFHETISRKLTLDLL